MTADYNPETTLAAGRSDGAPAAFTLSVVSHGQGALVEGLLGDLARLRPASLARVIVTRNLPEPPIAVPQGFAAPIRFIDNPHPRGFGANHNAAFGDCASDWFVIVNPDIRLLADPFPALLAAAAPAVGLLAPSVLEADGRVADSARELVTPGRLAARVLARALARRSSGLASRFVPRGLPCPLGRPDTGPPAASDWYAGMFLAVRRNAFAAIGGFDERFHLYCEDVDLCARLRLAGWRLAPVADASVIHDARRASRRSLRHLGWHLASLARLWSSPTFRRYRALIARERGGADRPDGR